MNKFDKKQARHEAEDHLKAMGTTDRRYMSHVVIEACDRIDELEKALRDIAASGFNQPDHSIIAFGAIDIAIKVLENE